MANFTKKRKKEMNLEQNTGSLNYSELKYYRLI